MLGRSPALLVVPLAELVVLLAEIVVLLAELPVVCRDVLLSPAAGLYYWLWLKGNGWRYSTTKSTPRAHTAERA